jgi:hypothetical protein
MTGFIQRALELALREATPEEQQRGLSPDDMALRVYGNDDQVTRKSKLRAIRRALPGVLAANPDWSWGMPRPRAEPRLKRRGVYLDRLRARAIFKAMGLERGSERLGPADLP